MLMNIEEKYPGMTEFFRIGGISAQAQTKHAIRTATDQRGEQNINEDAKVILFKVVRIQIQLINTQKWLLLNVLNFVRK